MEALSKAELCTVEDILALPDWNIEIVSPGSRRRK